MTASKLRALLLDFGGTLVFEEPSRAAIYAEAARSRGKPVTDDEMARLMEDADLELPVEVDGAFRYSDRWLQQFMETIFHVGLGLPKDALPGIEDELFGRFSDAATFRFFPGVRELLTAAREAGLRLALVSNWSARLPELVRNLGLESQFDAVVASAIEGVEKPDPELFERALERLDVPAHEALHAGDRFDKDVFGALSAGIEVVLVDHFDKIWSDVAKVSGLAELTELVLARAAPRPTDP